MSKPEMYTTFCLMQNEKDLFKEYCEQEARNQTEVWRELIRGQRKKS